jgi:hypothetical protein
MEIRRRAGRIEFMYSATRRVSASFGEIHHIKVFQDNVDKTRTVFWVNHGIRTEKFWYDEVTVPVTANASALEDLLWLWNGSGLDEQVFITSGGETSFTTSFALGSSVLAIRQGVVLSPSTYIYTVGGNTITLLAAALPVLAAEEFIFYSL